VGGWGVGGGGWVGVCVCVCMYVCVAEKIRDGNGIRVQPEGLGFRVSGFRGNGTDSNPVRFLPTVCMGCGRGRWV
jgi:hypothetical protein